MPGDKDGRDLGRLARSSMSNFKILYAAAYPEKSAEIRAEQGEHEDVIPEPHHYGELAQKTVDLRSHEDRAD